ncbi:hypothetical protein [Paludibaculum fermentans]|uniref:hypothetical protein n=1 Tax=Paludibaculum fermentans TaxID=1473598 RepID=UPI003EC137A3
MGHIEMSPGLGRAQAIPYGLRASLSAVLLLSVCTSATANITVSPQSVQRKQSLTLVVQVDNCTKTSDPHAFDTTDAVRKAPPISLSGSGIELSWGSAVSTGCTLSVPAQVTESAAFEDKVLIAYNKDKTEVLGTAKLQIIDIQSGPIPPGLAPQVDIIWNVLSDVGCKDQFGTRVSRHYYCLEVQIGNNSGYALLISGLGFMRHLPGLDYKEATSTYAQIRSVLQRDQVISGRNLTLRGLQGAGAVVAGFAPFARNPFERNRMILWSSIMGGVLAGAWDSFAKDRTVLQMTNLDDSALRDGKIIPNNSPVKFTVFADRDSVKPLLAGPTCIAEYYGGLLDQELARVQADLTLATGLGWDELKRMKLERERDRLRESKASLMRAGGQASAQDRRCAEGRIPVKGGGKLHFLGRPQSLRENDLIAVRQALGSLVIVGDQIEYKQRLRVDSSATVSEVTPLPQIAGVVDGIVPSQGGEPLDVKLSGRWLTGATVLSPDCQKCYETAKVNSTGTEITLKGFKVPDDYVQSVVTLQVATAGKMAEFIIPVKLHAPVVNVVAPAEVIIVPDAENKGVGITATGAYLSGSTFSGKITDTTSATVKEWVFDEKHLRIASPTSAEMVVDLTARESRANSKVSIVVTKGSESTKEVMVILRPPALTVLQVADNHMPKAGDAAMDLSLIGAGFYGVTVTSSNCVTCFKADAVKTSPDGKMLTLEKFSVPTSFAGQGVDLTITAGGMTAKYTIKIGTK